MKTWWDFGVGISNLVKEFFRHAGQLWLAVLLFGFDPGPFLIEKVASFGFVVLRSVERRCKEVQLLRVHLFHRFRRRYTLKKPLRQKKT